MAVWKCSVCGAAVETRCRPKECKACGAPKEKIEKSK